MGRAFLLLAVWLVSAAAAWAEEGGAIPPPAGAYAIGQTQSAADLFGSPAGRVHPFFGLTEWYTDNLFNRPENEATDFTTVFSPGIWLALPASDVRLMDVQTLNVAPGGLAVSRFEERAPKRYQTYALYQGDYEVLAKNSSQDTMNHRAEGRFRYNTRRGLSLDVADQYVHTHDPRSTGISLGLDKYDANLVDVTLSYDTGNRLGVSGDYSNYSIDYLASRNRDRDRVDNTFGGQLSYRVEPKTTVFLQYEHADIDYEQGEFIQDSTEDRFYGGLQWDVTAKSRGRVRAGYGLKHGDQEDGRDLLLELQAYHFFTPKTSVRITAARRLNETPIPGTDFLLSHSVYVQYAQRATSKISGLVTASYTNDRYEGELSFGGETKHRDDDVYTGDVSIGYEPRRWLNFSVGYEYARRDSTFSFFDYAKNTVFLTARVGL